MREASLKWHSGKGRTMETFVEHQLPGAGEVLSSLSLPGAWEVERDE